MPDLLEANGTGTNADTDAERSVSERLAALGRRSGAAHRRKREAEEELSVDDKAERELDRLLSSPDPKEREKVLFSPSAGRSAAPGRWQASAGCLAGPWTYCRGTEVKHVRRAGTG